MRAPSLLGPADPAPVEVVNGDSAHPLLLVCEHAGRAIPGALGTLGVDTGDRDSHIGWDIGAAAVTRLMAEKLGAPAVLQPYSRLVIDCNRPPEAPDSVPEVSHGIPVPSNRDGALRAARIAEIFDPFNDAVTRFAARPGRRVLISVHSFTPVLAGVARPWEIGLLYRADAATSGRMAALLSARRPSLVIGMNQPYDIDDLSDWFVPRHGERTGLPHSLLEIRNDEIAAPEGQRAWAALLSDVMMDFIERGNGC